MKFRSAMLLCILSSVSIGCSDTNETKSTPRSEEAAVAGHNPELWPENVYTVKQDPEIEKRIQSILEKMSLEEKVGQIIQGEIKFASPEDVKKYHLGSVLNGGGTNPNNDKYATASDWADLANQYYLASMDESDGKMGIPILWGSDAVHGHNNVIGATLFPHNIGLGAAHDVELIERIGAATGVEVKATGIDWTFAPTVAVVNDVRWGRTYESYAEDPALVADYSRAMVKGLQGPANLSEITNGSRIIATVKHYLADGGTYRGIDRGDTQISEQELVEVHAPSFVTALEQGVQTVMASFSSWNGVKMHAHKYLLTDILKHRMGFDGLVVGDWNAHAQPPGCTVESCPIAINAGIDLIMVPSDWKAFYHNTLAQAKSGEISQERLDDAVSRVLRVKLRTGLFEMGEVSQRPLVQKPELLGASSHREIALEAVRKSLVLLKNNDSTLPISSQANILVLGDGANNISKQSGGWSITWQGTGNKNEDYVGATSIFAGIRDKAAAFGGEAILVKDNAIANAKFTNNQAADVAVVVFGEEPYAEWHGDITSIEYQQNSKTDLALLKQIQALDIPVVSIFLTGRPLRVNAEINASDAFVVAWLPGSEGQGIADVILSKENDQIAYDFTGKLSFSWPNSADQAVLNNRLDEYKPLFPYGFGLSYADKTSLAKLSEETSSTSDELEALRVFVSRPISPWQIMLRSGTNNEVMTGNHLEFGSPSLFTGISVDKIQQEDSRQFRWHGIAPVDLAFGSVQSHNLLYFYEHNSALTMDIRLDSKATEDVLAKFNCGVSCDHEIAITDALNALPEKQWTSFSIDYRCLFPHNGLGYQQIHDIFAISTAGELGVTIANVKLTPNFEQQPTIACKL